MDDALRKHPDLPLALRWLRHRAKLRQSDVAESVKSKGGTISPVHYRKVESVGGSEKAKRVPSEEMLEQILAGLGSNAYELKVLLDNPPWVAKPESLTNYRMSSNIPQATPPLLRSATRSLASPGGWDNLKTQSKITNDVSLESQAPSSSLSFASAPVAASFGDNNLFPTLPLISPEASLEIQEISETYPRLSRNSQITLHTFFSHLARNEGLG
jgi:hypothetical protein